MHASLRVLPVLLSVLLLSACVSMPDGPSVMALPGTGKSFDQFRYDDVTCRQYANTQIGGMTANQAASDSLAKSAIVGSALGAAVGVATGGGRGAGVGAATGLAVGSAVGLDSANASSYGAQRRYDNAYIQCMYAKGHRVPVSGRVMTEQPQRSYQYEPAPLNYPPPPPGYSR
ncbi:MAG: glycine zipper family protein [Formivibrio sp.]|nr:glycine zipper family protein [Formivibrio sp.]